MKEDESTLWLKFSGEGLDVRSVPIYELGEVFIALQRIVHKAYLIDKQKHKKYAQLTQAERRKLALQIRERQKGSDLFALVPFLADAAVREYLATLLKVGVGALSKYALKSVFADEKPVGSKTATAAIRDVEGSAITGAIYGEVVQITNHVHNIGYVEKIEIYIGDRNKAPDAAITADTQAYVRDLASSRYYGERTELHGYLHSLQPNHLQVEVRVGPRRRVKVQLNTVNFDFIRYKTSTGQSLVFAGRPIIRLDKSPTTFDMFDAESVQASDEFVAAFDDGD